MGVLDLLDVLKNADFLTGFTDEFFSVAAYERIDRATLQRRLLLALFALGTNMGIRAIVATGRARRDRGRPAARAPALQHPPLPPGRHPAGWRSATH
ncbi:Tn3 family transposase [Streptomyces sp. AC555_RSS877]|uniref:Tn3 family transposase n=1 Tax=Streptomyces sp. AC555_RSS877 TaxID=2823688 RepID=UPI001C267B8E|nr:Tn3 family transposase [Streptomyces sp. AC555_RSS877]